MWLCWLLFCCRWCQSICCWFPMITSCKGKSLLNWFVVFLDKSLVALCIRSYYYIFCKIPKFIHWITLVYWINQWIEKLCFVLWSGCWKIGNENVPKPLEITENSVFLGWIRYKCISLEFIYVHICFNCGLHLDKHRNDVNYCTPWEKSINDKG